MPRRSPASFAIGLALILAACATTPPQSTTYGPGETIDPARLASHVRALASDEFLGRGPAEPGEASPRGYSS